MTRIVGPQRNGTPLLKFVLGAFGLLFLLAAAMFYFIAADQTRSARTLLEDPLQAVGTILSKRTEAQVRNAGTPEERTGPTRYLVAYSYTHPLTGETHEIEDALAESAWKGFEVGRSYRLVVARDDPAVTSLLGGAEFREGAEAARTLWRIFALLGLAMLGLRWWLYVRRGAVGKRP